MQHQLVILRQLIILVSCFTSLTVTGQADGCPHIWSASELVRAAKQLDGQVVCVRALLRPLPMHDRSSISLFVYEAVPLNPKQRRLDANRIGLVDWAKELGIDESLNRPKSESLLKRAANRCPGNKDELSFDAEFRAVVEYKKGLTERSYSALPPNLAAEKPRRTHYDTELVFLEFLRVTAICQR